MKQLFFLWFAAVVMFGGSLAAEKPNILIVTVDDMNCDSVGAFGCQLADTTPNIDQLAARGMRYHYAHVQVGNCYPSRNVMFSGRYPHNTKVEGFYQVKEPNYPHMVDLMKSAGYYVGIRGKVSHSTPYQPYAWDDDLTILDGQKQDIKNAQSYYHSMKAGIENAKLADKPFCLNFNISDPHKPFYALGKNGVVPDRNLPSHVFKPEEVPIPGFLFDHPDVRLELAHYYSSVRRADDCFGEIMRALRESGKQGNTVVMFLSDHGMPLPFAKTALWHHSTRTPWIVYWPGVTKPGTIDKEHMISAVDLMPTLLDIVGADHPEGFDGHSFMPTIKGEKQPGRDMVYKVYNENSGGNRNPMRSVESKRFGYLFNPWCDGKRVFKTATTGTFSFRAMKAEAATNPEIAKRLDLFVHGVPEEFYDYENDPDALVNLIDDPAYADQLAVHRAAMKKFIDETGDHIKEAFDGRNDPAIRNAYVERVQAEANARRAAKRKAKGTKADRKRKEKTNPAAKRNQDKNLFALGVPESWNAGGQASVVVKHNLPTSLGTQKIHVTLKTSEGKRITRVVREISGKGETTVTFDEPVGEGTYQVSAFVGEDYPGNLLHKTVGPVKTVK